MNLDAEQRRRFEYVQAAYRKFYDIRNQPAPGVDYEDWEAALTPEQRTAWAGRLAAQAAEVIAKIGTNDDLTGYRPFHEIKSFFYEDLRDLEGQLGKYELELRPSAAPEGGHATLEM